MKLHQALHGYVNGHRLLSASLDLRPTDAKRLLILSDASGPSVAIGSAGYLTGFALAESGVYALARTWPAPEMPRPGCVWTHTLLMTFEDLAAMQSPVGLLTLFQRPIANSTFSEYSTPVAYPAHLKPLKYATNALAVATLVGLYDQPQPVGIMADLTDTDEALILAIWGQQWPRLRRSFRFCTQISADRSSDDATFDLQFFPSIRRTRPQLRQEPFVIADVSTYKDLSQPAWLNSAIQDLENFGSTRGLASFLREVGMDVEGGRSAFKPLATIYSLLNAGTATGVIDASRLADEFGAEAAVKLKDVVAAQIVRRLPDSAEAFPFIMKSWSTLSQATRVGMATTYLKQTVDALGKLGCNTVFAFLREQDERHTLALHAVRNLDVESLLQYLNEDPDAFGVALQHQPGLLAMPSLWNSSSRVRRIAVDWIRKNPSGVAVALPFLIKTESGDFATEIVRQVGPAAILDVLVSTAESEHREEFDFCDARWIDAATSNRNTLAKLLAEQRPLTRKSLVAFARSLPPDMVPNDYGDDPWVTAVHASSGEASQRGTLYLLAYLFVRALGYASRNQAELLRLSFQQLHEAAVASAIPEDAWELFRHRVSASLFENWDRAETLRVVVVNTFVDRRLDTNAFLDLCDEPLFGQLTTIASATYWGHSYLKAVRRSADNSVSLSKRDWINRALSNDD